MKKIGFILLLLASTSVFAFGGGGGGRVSSTYKSGVDALDIHVNPDKPIDPPIFIDCNEQTETEIKGVCCANEKVYANGTKCCDKAGYEIKDDECQKICPTGLMPVGDECVNLCENYTPTECKPTCDWKTGQGKTGNEGNLCNNNQGHCNNGECEPIVCGICTELNTSTGNCDTKACATNAHCDNDNTSETKNTCVCNEGYEPDGQGGCKESSSAKRQCGETYCGEGNVCVDNTYCCHKNYEDWGGIEDSGACCLASESAGFNSEDFYCCASGETTFTYNEYQDTRCCSGSSYPNVGHGGFSVCCNHMPTDYTDVQGNTFKVCWTEETECKSNADCASLGENYFCNLKNDTDGSCYYPTSGTCEQITTGHFTDANDIPGLGNVRRSTSTMTWWAADNWCKAQGMNLIDISQFGCYANGTTLVQEGSNYDDGCCASGQTCSYDNTWYTNGNKAKYSSTLKALESAFGHGYYFWTSSDSNTDSCLAFVVDLTSGVASNANRDANGLFALCK